MGARILVIDDDPINLELITYLLEAYGHEASRACDGESGLQMLHGQLPDVILCDVQLTKLSGYGVVHCLKSNPRTKKIPVIAVTALAMAEDRARVFEAGFDGYLSKPIDSETFVSQIEQYLQSHSSMRYPSGLAPTA
jgi:CheY-like chemotaxis protein